MDNVKLSKKAREGYIKAENEIKKTCCSEPSYEMALPSYKAVYTYYKSLKDTGMVIEISDKIILCNQKIRNYIGIATQYENITEYLTMFAPVYFTDICKYYESGYKAYLDIDNINKSASTLIKYLSYLDKMNSDDEIRYLEIIEKTMGIANGFVESDYLYKITILKTLFPYIVRYTEKEQITNFMDNMIKIFRRLNQPHNIYIMMLSNILYLTSIYDFESAKKALDEYYKLDKFIMTEQCEIARDILFLCNGDKQVPDIKIELDLLLKKNLLHPVIKEIYNKIKTINIEKIKEINTVKTYEEFDIM
jgi:hypothetical protein